MKETPRFLLSKSALLRQYETVRGLADEVSFSHKTNPDVGRLLEKLTDCSLSMHTGELLDSVNDMNRVWFFAQAWDPEETKRLLSLGIRRFVVDNETDLNILLDSLNGNRVDLLLRMRLKENTIQTGKHFVFGMQSGQINRLVPKLRKNPMIGKLGIHFHRKTQNISEWMLKNELEQILSPETLESADILNMGGGLPAEYKNSRAAAVLDGIFSQIRTLRSWLKDWNIALTIEPGRYLAAPPVRLETTIRSIHDNSVTVDASVYNSAMDTFGAHVRLLVEGETTPQEGRPYTIKGCTPCSLDIFRYRVFLKGPKVGGKIVFLNAGAYNFSSDFCSLSKPKTVVVD